MPSVFAYQNRLNVTAAQAVAYTDVGTTFDSAQPLTNLGTMQLPRFAAFAGATATIEAEATDGGDPASAAPFSADVFAVLGIENLEAGATIEFFDNDTGTPVSLGSVTWTPVAGQRHARSRLHGRGEWHHADRGTVGGPKRSSGDSPQLRNQHGRQRNCLLQSRRDRLGLRR